MPPLPPRPQNFASVHFEEIHEVNSQVKDHVIITSDSLRVARPKLEDYESTDDLRKLTVKEMKIILSLYRVNFRGCIEKEELQDKVFRLWEDHQKHKEITENTSTEMLCKICMDAPLDCVLLNCGHIASCVECGKQLAECPICRQYVIRVVRTFKA